MARSIKYIGTWTDCGDRAFDHGKYPTSDIPAEFERFFLGLQKSGEKVGYFAIQSENWVCWSYGEASKVRWQRHGKQDESEAGGNRKEHIVLSGEIDFTITITGGAWGNATYEVRIDRGGRESNTTTGNGSGCLIPEPSDTQRAFAGLNDALGTENAACRAIHIESLATAFQISKNVHAEKRAAFDKVLSTHVDLFERQQRAAAEALKLFVADERVKSEAEQKKIHATYVEYCETEIHRATEALLSKVRALRNIILLQGRRPILPTEGVQIELGPGSPEAGDV